MITNTFRTKERRKGKFYFFLFICFFRAACFYSQEEAITLKTSTGEIKGTLLLPALKTKIPLVLIIAGSGPTDRNGNQSSAENNSLKLLAEELAKNGIASVRFDKRGVGESAGAFEDESALRFDTYVSDVSGWIDFLAPDKRFGKLIVAGHSEGSLLGMAAAAKSTKVSAFISIAGAGRPADEILKEQFSKVEPAVK